MIFILFNLLTCVLLLRIWSVWVNVLCELEKLCILLLVAAVFCNYQLVELIAIAVQVNYILTDFLLV